MFLLLAFVPPPAPPPLAFVPFMLLALPPPFLLLAFMPFMLLAFMPFMLLALAPPVLLAFVPPIVFVFVPVVVLVPVLVVEELVVVEVFVVVMLALPFEFSVAQPVQKAATASKAKRAKVLRIEFSPVTLWVKLVKRRARLTVLAISLRSDSANVFASSLTLSAERACREFCPKHVKNHQNARRVTLPAHVQAGSFVARLTASHP